MLFPAATRFLPHVLTLSVCVHCVTDAISRKQTDDSFLARGCALHCMAYLVGRVLTDAINHTQTSWNSLR